MKEYVTTNIRIQASRLKEFKLLAIEKGKSVSELIREAMDKYVETSDNIPVKLELKKGKQRVVYPESSFWELAPEDLGNTNSEIIESELYGEK